jgi:PAS domain S-box-containing protein
MLGYMMTARHRVALSARQIAALAALLVVCLGLSGAAWQHQRNVIEERAAARFEREVMRVEVSIRDSMRSYADLLRAGGGLYVSGDGGSPQRWRALVGSLDIAHNYPGIAEMSAVLAVAGSEKTALEARQRGIEGGKDFRIHPASDGRDHMVVVATEPAERSPGALGYDLGTSPPRRIAAQHARDEASPVMTERLTLLQRGGSNRDAVIFLPLYRLGAAIDTVEHRQAALTGWVTVGFHIEGMFLALLRDEVLVHVTAYDGAAGPDTLLFDSNEGVQEPDQPGIINRTTSINLYGRSWTLNFRSTPHFHRYVEDHSPLLVLIAGLVCSLSLWWGALGLATSRARGLSLALSLTKAVRVSRQRYRTIIATTSQGYLEIDAAAITIDVNNALCRMLGYTRAELRGKPVTSLVAPYHRHQIDVQLARRPHTANRHYDIDLQRKDGAFVHANFHATTQYNAEGKVTGSFALVADITHIRRTEAALRESESRYRILVDNIQDGLAIISEHKLRFVNASFAHIIGRSADDLIGLDFLDLIAPEDRDIIDERYRLRQGGLAVPDEYTIRLLKVGNRQPVTVKIRAAVVDNANGTRSTIATVNEVVETVPLAGDVG